MNNHWKITGDQEYFHVTGLEYPTLLVNLAKWLMETNVSPDHIVIDSQFTDDVHAEDEYYVSATVSYTSTLTKKFDDPFGEEVEELDEEAFLDDMIALLEKHGMIA